MSLISSNIIVADPEKIIVDSSGMAQRANSIPETWIANSLNKYKLEFQYQQSRRGGRAAPGGMIVDFIVRSGLTTALEYAGAYWHRRGIDETLKWSYLLREFDRLVIFSDEPMHWLGGWVSTDIVVDQETSDYAVRKHFL